MEYLNFTIGAVVAVAVGVLTLLYSAWPSRRRSATVQPPSSTLDTIPRAAADVHPAIVYRKVRPRPGFIGLAEHLAHPVYSLASRINAEYFEAVARRRVVQTRGPHWPAVLMSIGVSQRLAVVCRGRLSALLVQKLICSPSEPRHATAVVSRRHFVGLKDSDATCVSTLQGHSGGVNSVAFHPSAPYLATGSSDNTAKLWR